MTTSARKTPLRNGLRDISMEAFWKDPLIVVENLHLKLQGLPIDPKRYPIFVKEMSLAMELLRAIGTRRYGRISFIAALEVLQAAHYFLLLTDRKPDSQADGYKDDAEIFHQAFTKHAGELDEFEGWLRGQG